MRSMSCRSQRYVTVVPLPALRRETLLVQAAGAGTSAVAVSAERAGRRRRGGRGGVAFRRLRARVPPSEDVRTFGRREDWRRQRPRPRSLREVSRCPPLPSRYPEMMRDPCLTVRVVDPHHVRHCAAAAGITRELRARCRRAAPSRAPRARRRWCSGTSAGAQRLHRARAAPRRPARRGGRGSHRCGSARR